MRFAILFCSLLFVQSASAALTMTIQGTITSQYEIDKNNIAEESDRSFEGQSQATGQLYHEKINQKETVETDLKPAVQFLAPKKTSEKFEIPSQKKVFVNAAKEILAPYVNKNRNDGLHSNIQYRLANSSCERFGQSIICETRLWARLQGNY